MHFMTSLRATFEIIEETALIIIKEPVPLLYIRYEGDMLNLE